MGVGPWQAEAYDPATESWRVIADPPCARREGDFMIVWTGSELIVWWREPDRAT